MCGARALVPVERGDWRSCEWCGARSHRAAAPLPRLQPGRIEDQAPAGWHVDDYVARGWAAAQCLDYRADRAVSAAPRGHGGPAAGRLEPFRQGNPRDVTLAILARPGDPNCGTLAAMARGVGFADTVVVQDADVPEPVENATVVARPLDGFGAQRDLAQRVAKTAWVFHLDTDESIHEHLPPMLAGIIAVADRELVDAVGFPRRNLVDGATSDLWPDPQYRLVRATQRYHGRVHERPEACRDWRRTMTLLAPDPHGNGWCFIGHHLSRNHVVSRTKRYDALGQDADRQADEAALLRPYLP